MHAAEFQSIHKRHPDVGQNNIRAELFRQFKGFLSVFCLPDPSRLLGYGI